MKRVITIMLLGVGSLWFAGQSAEAAQKPNTNNVAGKTIKYTNNAGQTYWTTYYKNGKSRSKSTRRTGKGYIYDTGRWEYRNGQLCESYDHWRGGREFCRGPSSGRTARGGETCSFQNAKCMDFCENTPAGRAQGRLCTNTCQSRQRVCLKTGIYEWRNSPNVTGLERR